MNKIITIKFKKILNILIFFAILFILLLFSKQNFDCVKQSLATFFTSVFPALFPFILFTEISLKTNILEELSNIFGKFLSKLFKINKNGISAIIIGFLCGFPMGAKTVSSLYNQKKITRDEALKLLSFVNNCNPAFILSTVGIGIFFNTRIGILLLVSHYLSAIIIGILCSHNLMPYIIHENEVILNNFGKKNDKKCNYGSNFNILKISIKNTFSTLLMILGYILVFNLLFNIVEIFLLTLNVNTSYISILSGLFEITKGIKDIFLDIHLNSNLKICIASFMLGFSGLCIIFQIYSCIYEDNFRLNNLLKSKLIHGIISFIITYLLIKYTNIYVPQTNLVFNQIDQTSLSYDTYMQNLKSAYLVSTVSLIFLLTIYFLFQKYRQKKQSKLLDHFKY